MTERPSYTTSKRQLWLSFVFGWLVIFLIVWGGLSGVREAVDLAGIVVPSMIALIAALLGIHRWTGSLDFKAAQERLADEATTKPPYDARAQPEGEVQ